MDDSKLMPGDELLNFREVAELLAVKPGTVRIWKHKGIIPFVKVGPSAVRYRKSEVLRLITEGRLNS